MVTPARIKRGTATRKWPFFQTLKVGFYAEELDVQKHDALRTAATREGTRLKRKFTVRKEESTVDGTLVDVIRVYRMK